MCNRGLNPVQKINPVANLPLLAEVEQIEIEPGSRFFCTRVYFVHVNAKRLIAMHFLCV